MGENEEFPALGGAPARWSIVWFQRQVTRSLLGQFNVPGWVLFLLAVVIGVPDWKSRYDFWLSIAAASGQMSIIANVLLWPYFSPSLGVLGILYVLTATSVERAGHQYAALPIIAWVVVSASTRGGITKTHWSGVSAFLSGSINKIRTSSSADFVGILSAN